MQIGASTACYYPLETEKSLERLGSLGFRTTEIFFNSFSELTPSFTESLNEILKRYAMRAVSLHPFTSFAESYLLFSAYRRRFVDSMEFYKRYFETANRIGAKILVIHGATLPGTISEEVYFARFQQLVQAGRVQGVTVAQENVVRFVSESPDFLGRMQRALGDDFHMVLDVKQAVRAGYDPLLFVRKLAAHIVHIHLSDHLPGYDCLPPGDGSFDFGRLFALLRDAGYRGEAVIELYRQSFQSDAQLIKARGLLEKEAAPSDF